MRVIFNIVFYIKRYCFILFAQQCIEYYQSKEVGSGGKGCYQSSV